MLARKNMYLNKSNQTMQDKYPHLSKIWQDSIAEAFIDFARAENLSFWQSNNQTKGVKNA